MQCTTRPFHKCKKGKEIKGFNRCGIPYAQCAHRHGPRMLSILTARLMHLGKLERDTEYTKVPCLRGFNVSSYCLKLSYVTTGWRL
jgi:hypothetical protein